MSANCQRKENHFVKTKHAKACMLMASATGRYRRIQQPEYWSIIITNNNTTAGGQFRSALVRNWASSSTASVHLTRSDNLPLFYQGPFKLLGLDFTRLHGSSDPTTTDHSAGYYPQSSSQEIARNYHCYMGDVHFRCGFRPLYHKFSMLSKLYSPVFTSVQLISAFSCFGSLCFCIH